jgi:hypothetical protein
LTTHTPYREPKSDALHLADRELATRIGRTRVGIAMGIVTAAVCLAPAGYFASCALSLSLLGAYFPRASAVLAAAVIVMGLAGAERIAVTIVRRCIPRWVKQLATKYDADPDDLFASATPHRAAPRTAESRAR